MEPPFGRSEVLADSRRTGADDRDAGADAEDVPQAATEGAPDRELAEPDDPTQSQGGELAEVRDDPARDLASELARALARGLLGAVLFALVLAWPEWGLQQRAPPPAQLLYLGALLAPASLVESRLARGGGIRWWSLSLVWLGALGAVIVTGLLAVASDGMWGQGSPVGALEALRGELRWLGAPAPGELGQLAGVFNFELAAGDVAAVTAAFVPALCAGPLCVGLRRRALPLAWLALAALGVALGVVFVCCVSPGLIAVLHFVGMIVGECAIAPLVCTATAWTLGGLLGRRWGSSLL